MLKNVSSAMLIKLNKYSALVNTPAARLARVIDPCF